jgi:hypothetical protein
MPNATEISFYIDTLLVETVLAEPVLYKKAGFMSDVLSRVKEYFESKIDKEHPVESVLNLLAPAGISFLFRAIGFGKFGMLLGLLTSVFHINVAGMVESLYGKVKEMLGSGNKVSSSQIDQAVSSTVEEHSTPATSQEAQEGYQAMQQGETAPAEDGKFSSLELLHDAKIINLALIEYERQTMRLTKTADFSSFFKIFSGKKAEGTTILGSILGWIFKLALTAAGLMVAGDVVNKILHRPNSFDGNYQAQNPNNSTTTATQTKYHPIGDAPLPRDFPLTNTPDNIGNMIVQFAKDTYSGLDGKEDLIRNTPGFQVIKQKIAWANVYNPGSATIIIPSVFTSKKQLVDYFIDDVAKADA